MLRNMRRKVVQRSHNLYVFLVQEIQERSVEIAEYMAPGFIKLKGKIKAGKRNTDVRFPQSQL